MHRGDSEGWRAWSVASPSWTSCPWSTSAAFRPRRRWASRCPCAPACSARATTGSAPRWCWSAPDGQPATAGPDGARRRRTRPLRRLGHARRRGRLDVRGARLVRPARDLGARCRAQDPGRGRRRADVHRGRPAARPGRRRPDHRRPRGARSSGARVGRPRHEPARGGPAGRPAVPELVPPAGRAPAARAGHGRGSLPAVRRPAAGAVQRVVRVLPAVGGRVVRREDAARWSAAPSGPPPSGSTPSPRWGSTWSTCPPIHPIGEVNRKGPNNTLDPGPDDPGSPWAIGSKDGGHDAIHPDLGTLDDFDAFVAQRPRARARGGPRPGPAVRARPPVGDQPPRVVHHPGRRHDRLRREPAEEVPGHLPPELRQRPRRASAARCSGSSGTG